MIGPTPPPPKLSGLPPHLDALYQVLGTQKKANEAKLKLQQVLKARALKEQMQMLQQQGGNPMPGPLSAPPLQGKWGGPY